MVLEIVNVVFSRLQLVPDFSRHNMKIPLPRYKLWRLHRSEKCYVAFSFSFSFHLVLTKLMLMCNDNITEYYCVKSSLPHPLEPWQSLVCSSSTHAQTEAAWSNYKIITDRPAQRTLMQLLPFPSSVLRCDVLYFRQVGASVQYYFRHI